MTRFRRRWLSPLDGALLLLESPDTPMHVGGLMEFSSPAGSGSGHLEDWKARLLGPQVFAPPFNLCPVRGPLGGRRTPILRPVGDIKLSNHVKFWTLPTPGSQRELGALVSRLHSEQLNFTVPLWELHVIEGLDDDRFALYLKIHHTLIDGVSAMRHLARTLSTNPTDLATPMLWSVPRPEPVPQAPGPRRRSKIARAWKAIRGLIRAGHDLRTGEIDGLPLRAPYDVPRSPLGSQITAGRRFATQSYPVEQFKRLAQAAGCTVNDIVLYLCGTALRSYLKDLGQLPERSLTAGIPVNLRKPGDEKPGTAVGFLVAELGTHIPGPLERLSYVARSAKAAKNHLRTLPEESLPLQTLLTNAPYMAGLVAGLGNRSPIAFNITISNVPGPTDQLHFNGARLDGMYPMSLLTHGNALNITCVSHDTRLDFGILAASDALPHVQRLAIAMGAAVAELELLLAKGPRTSNPGNHEGALNQRMW